MERVDLPEMSEVLGFMDSIFQNPSSSKTKSFAAQTADVCHTPNPSHFFSYLV